MTNLRRVSYFVPYCIFLAVGIRERMGITSYGSKASRVLYSHLC